MSPLSWLILQLFLALFVLLFKPTLKEFLIFLLVDTLAFFAIALVDGSLFLYFFPASAAFFPTRSRLRPLPKNDSGKDLLLHAMMKFPARRALYCVAVSFLKGVPGALVMLYYWNHQVSYGTQLLLIVLTAFTAWSYFGAVVYLENHALISKDIVNLHGVLDLTKSFRNVRVERHRKEILWFEVGGIVSIWLFMLLLQGVVVSELHPAHPSAAALNCSAVAVAGLLLVTRIWYLHRSIVNAALSTLFGRLDTLDFEADPQTIPLHSMASVAQFEKKFNSLLQKLKTYREELSRWVVLQNQEGRYRAIGEISSMIMHDLSAPLQVVRFCVEQLQNDPNKIHDANYLTQLDRSAQRSLDLVYSLRSYLRESGPARMVEVRDAHEKSLKILQTELYSMGFATLSFDVDPRATELWVEISRPDLIHILLNLYRNSAENLLWHKVERPRIQVRLQSVQAETVSLTIEDNGTGLSPDEFEKITAISSPAPFLHGDRSGLGLRLTRRLVERAGGKLDVTVPQRDSWSATQITLTLKRADSERKVAAIPSRERTNEPVEVHLGT